MRLPLFTLALPLIFVSACGGGGGKSGGSSENNLSVGERLSTGTWQLDVTLDSSWGSSVEETLFLQFLPIGKQDRLELFDVLISGRGKVWGTTKNACLGQEFIFDFGVMSPLPRSTFISAGAWFDPLYSRLDIGSVSTVAIQVNDGISTFPAEAWIALDLEIAAGSGGEAWVLHSSSSPSQVLIISDDNPGCHVSFYVTLENPLLHQ